MRRCGAGCAPHRPSAAAMRGRAGKRTRWLLLTCVGTAALALGGCGSGSTGSSGAGASQSATSHPAPTTAASARSAASGRAKKGGSASEQAASAASSAVTTAKALSKTSSGLTPQVYEARANAACEAAASSIPRSGGTRGAGARGARDALPEGAAGYIVLQLKLEVLTRLQPPSTLRGRVEKLTAALAHLKQMGMSRGGKGARGGLTSALTREAALDAEQANLLACGPTTGNEGPTAGAVPPGLRGGAPSARSPGSLPSR